MCGLFGSVVSKSSYNDRDFLKCLAHRGPDSQNFLSVGTIRVGHSLLAVRTNSSANFQPLEINGRWVITFNGEIYRTPDEVLNNKLRSDASSEIWVLESLIKSYGSNFLSYIRGMYAMVIVDKLKKTITLARDGSGQKPLFYHLTGGQLSHWASELPALMKISRSFFEFNTDYFIKNISFGFAKSDDTLARDVFQVAPNSFLTFDFEGTFLRQGNIESTRTTLSAKTLDDTFKEVFKSHLLSNQRAALSLSGGLDSGTLAALATHNSVKMEMFSTRFLECPEEYNWDFKRAKRLSESLGQHFNVVEVSSHSYIQNIENSHFLLDDPVYNQSLPVYLQLINEVKEVYPDIRVLYSGAGGDELFAGYKHDRRYLKHLIFSRVIGTYLYKSIFRLKNHSDLNLDPKIFWYQYRSLRFPQGVLKFNPVGNNSDLFATQGKEISGNKLLNALLDENLGWLRSDNLQYLDRFSMSKQMESRAPFCDSELITWCRSEIDFLRLDCLYPEKKPLVKIAREILPEWYFSDLKKKGWAAPIKYWYETKPEFQKYFQEFFEQAEKTLDSDLIDWVVVQSHLKPGMPYPGKWIMYLYSTIINIRKLIALN